jgi:arsenate reductase
VKLYPLLDSLFNKLHQQTLPEERKIILQPLIDHLSLKAKLQSPIRLNMICTHNSRRSHLCQIWAQTAALFYDIPKVECYSGGTEATAMFSQIRETLIQQGFDIHTLSEGENPVHAIKSSPNSPPIIAFSKKYNHPYNPNSNYTAILTCDSANEACPIVSGAEQRFPILYQDPKIADGTPEMEQSYLSRSLQIANEMNHVFKAIRKTLDHQNLQSALT